MWLATDIIQLHRERAMHEEFMMHLPFFLFSLVSHHNTGMLFLIIESRFRPPPPPSPQELPLAGRAS